MDVPIEEGVYIDPKQSVEQKKTPAFGKGGPSEASANSEKFHAEGTVSAAGQLRPRPVHCLYWWHFKFQTKVWAVLL